jgi:hypothetical protein
MKTRAFVLASIVLEMFFSGMANAGPVITIDENGNGIGTVGPFFIAADPGPGGLGAALNYNLPIIGVQGDITFGLEPGIVFGGDLIRFNGNGTVIFYSDNVGGFDSLADTFSPPGALYANILDLQEVGPECCNGVFGYTPTIGQPGYDPSGPTYNFVSDVPEPETYAMMLAGLGLLGFVARRRKQQAA